MKNIKLTNKQKEKLLEMSNELFPHRKWQFWESENDSYPNNQMIGYNYTSVLGKKKYYPALEIHWFEFTCTHLLTKLVQHLGYENSTDYIGMNNGIPLDNTIVDYIYKYIYPLYK